MTRPKARPRRQTTRPPVRSNRPLTPPKLAVPRSGTWRDASPPPAWAGAGAPLGPGWATAEAAGPATRNRVHSAARTTRTAEPTRSPFMVEVSWGDDDGMGRTKAGA